MRNYRRFSDYLRNLPIILQVDVLLLRLENLVLDGAVRYGRVFTVGRFYIYAKPQKLRRKDFEKRQQSHPDVEAFSSAHRESTTSVRSS